MAMARLVVAVAAMVVASAASFVTEFENAQGQNVAMYSPTPGSNNQTLFDFTSVDINGRNVSLAEFKGNVTFVINVASFCGETKMSYQGMSTLYTKYAGKPFQILAFPCNQFGSQEPKSNQWIESFVRGNGTHHCGAIYCDWKGYFPYPLFSKTNVKPSWCTGTAADCVLSSSKCCSQNQGVWQWLNDVYPNNVPRWNFAGKHLFSKCDGSPKYYINDETVDPASLTPQIDELLAEQC